MSSKERWDTVELSSFLREYPKSFKIFEEIFQLARFTNTQLIHFLFDTKILNNTNKSKLLEYLKKNIQYDKFFTDTLIKQSKKTGLAAFNNAKEVTNFLEKSEDKGSQNYLILLLKATVTSYIESAAKKPEIIYSRLTNPNFSDVAERMAQYLIDNLQLNRVLKGIRIREYLENKRIPLDTKSIHGKYGKIRITQTLEKHGFINVDPILEKNNIKTLPKNLSAKGLENLRGKFAYATERYVEGVVKRDRKPKKFDFILLHDLKPKIVIETNFYSTSGTKIGINLNEYLELNEHIGREHSQLTFIWITDGNYWLTTSGKNDLETLYYSFGDRILNYNLFDKRLEELKEKMK
ncbi:MAG: DpnII family type II restriction endonuclease [Candidatus Freyarchaeota archaeon]